MIEFIGTTAAVLTTCSFLPQALMVLRTRDTAKALPRRTESGGIPLSVEC